MSSEALGKQGGLSLHVSTKLLSGSFAPAVAPMAMVPESLAVLDQSPHVARCLAGDTCSIALAIEVLLAEQTQKPQVDVGPPAAFQQMGCQWPPTGCGETSATKEHHASVCVGLCILQQEADGGRSDDLTTRKQRKSGPSALNSLSQPRNSKYLRCDILWERWQRKQGHLRPLCALLPARLETLTSSHFAQARSALCYSAPT